jgi:hypothetical protein
MQQKQGGGTQEKQRGCRFCNLHHQVSRTYVASRCVRRTAFQLCFCGEWSRGSFQLRLQLPALLCRRSRIFSSACSTMASTRGSAALRFDGSARIYRLAILQSEVS